MNILKYRLAVPIGICTCLDIMFSSIAFTYISITLYTIVKSGGTIWNLLFSILLKLQTPSWTLVSIVMLISSGIALGSYGSTSFTWIGVTMVLCASILGTMRWVITQFLLQKLPENANNR